MLKPADYKLYKCTQQPVSSQNRRLTKRRHLSWSGPNRQSRASSSRPSIAKADKSVLDNHNSALAHFTFLKIIQDQCYDAFPTEEEPYIAESPLGNAVKVWLYHHHFIQLNFYV